METEIKLYYYTYQGPGMTWNESNPLLSPWRRRQAMPAEIAAGARGAKVGSRTRPGARNRR